MRVQGARLTSFVALLIVASAIAGAQVPQPFPRPGTPAPPAPPRPAAPAQPATPQAPAAPQQAAGAPDEALLGVAIYPGAQFIGSYDAGRGQRFYLFGAAATFADIVNYYRTVLKTRGELVFEQPPVHMFDTGRFREETMAFPPSVTVKDYTWGGAQGFLMPLAGGKSQRFPTVIQIVPAVAGEK